jgi:cyclophilin family peptidyl-prolyl cis-trans isomerase
MTMKKFIFIIALLVMAACSNTSQKQLNDIRATIKTNKGDINLYLYPEAAPLAVLNFINLAERGFYNDLTFHRVVENFVIQGGDPLGTGTGGPGYTFENELAVEWLNFYDSGILAMANNGPDTNGSQFFITINPAQSLNGNYTAFGEIIDKADKIVVEKIEKGDIIKEITITGNTNWLYAKYKDTVESWNKTLDENDFVIKEKIIENEEN